MNPSAFCKEIAAPLGSTLHYALLYQSEAIKKGFYALFAFALEIQKITETYNEISISKMKLAWWKTEIENVYQQQASHPICQALLPIIEDYKLPKQLFIEYLDGAILKLDSDHFCTEEDLLFYCYREFGIIFILCAYLVSSTPSQLIPLANDLAVIATVSRMIFDYPIFLRLHKNIFPLAYIQSDEETDEKVITLAGFNKLQDLCQHYFEKAIKNSDKKMLKSLEPLIIISKINLSLVNEIKKDNFAVTTKKYSLTPLRKLFIAWRIHKKI